MNNRLSSVYTYLKTKLFTASIFFTLAVILIGGITYIELPCPVCEGEGWVTGVGGLEVTELEYELVNHEIVGLECGWDYERYTYDFKISVRNTTTSPLYGMISLTFHDPESTQERLIEEEDEDIIVIDVGPVISVQNIFVEQTDAGAERTIDETIMFDGVTLELFEADVHEVVVHTEEAFICPFHGESNKVTLTEWLRLR